MFVPSIIIPAYLDAPSKPRWLGADCNFPIGTATVGPRATPPVPTQANIVTGKQIGRAHV